MLYDRWRQVVRDGGGERALYDVAAGRGWSFRELGDEAERRGTVEAADLVFPQGTGVEFVLEVLRGWRAGAVVCPLDAGQDRPGIGRPPTGVVHLKLTSATTGPSRCVAFTGAQLAADADNITSTMGLRRDWPNLGVISLAHSYGFSNLVLPLLLKGIPLILCPGPLPAVVEAGAGLAQDLTLAGVPALWRTWDEAGCVPSNVRLAISAGAGLPVALEQSIHTRSGLKVHNFYGSSECGGIAYDRTNVVRQDGALAGTVLDNVRVSIGPEGCLEVRGAAVGEGYWPEPDPRLGGGLFRTADLATLRGDEVRLGGRASDIINVAGRKLDPAMVEQVLLQHPQISACLVLGLPEAGGIRGDRVAAVLSLRGAVDFNELRLFMLERMPAWQIPREWKTVTALETGPRGKPSRAFWREAWGAPTTG